MGVVMTHPGSPAFYSLGLETGIVLPTPPFVQATFSRDSLVSVRQQAPEFRSQPITPTLSLGYVTETGLS